MLARALLALFVLMAFSSIALRAAEPKEAVSNDPDFLVQGEYVGEVTHGSAKKKLGAQVIALGKGKFRFVLRNGGLPGDGWDKSQTPGRDGETTDGVTTIPAGEYTAKIKEGALMLTADGNVVAGTLKRVVRKSSTLGAKPPEGAIVLFDGKNADQFENGRMTDDGLLKQGATTKFKHQSGTLHLEFQLPFGPLEPSRGNSGCYLQSRYEVQMLDSFGMKTNTDPHECGGIPSIKASDINMNYPPLSWQTYDVDFTAAQYKESKKVKHARMTIRHNGVVIHRDVEVPHITTSAPLQENPEPGPINLQDHHSEVRYRNIWFVEKS